jgi:hypothetical protein
MTTNRVQKQSVNHSTVEAGAAFHSFRSRQESAAHGRGHSVEEPSSGASLASTSQSSQIPRPPKRRIILVIDQGARCSPYQQSAQGLARLATPKWRFSENNSIKEVNITAPLYSRNNITIDFLILITLFGLRNI